MILKFPDLDTLRLSILSGAAPPAVVLTGAVFGSDDQSHIWVETAAPLSRVAKPNARNRRPALQNQRGEQPDCGKQLAGNLPLQRDPDSIERLEQTPILFEVANQRNLGRLIIEILRLGNDRQTFRWLENISGQGRGLLRVVGPPYYSLLRAIDRDGQTSPPRYRERSPGVWVEVGWTPLADYLKPPPGKLLLVASPRMDMDCG